MLAAAASAVQKPDAEVEIGRKDRPRQIRNLEPGGGPVDFIIGPDHKPDGGGQGEQPHKGEEAQPQSEEPHAPQEIQGELKAVERKRRAPSRGSARPAPPRRP